MAPLSFGKLAEALVFALERLSGNTSAAKRKKNMFSPKNTSKGLRLPPNSSKPGTPMSKKYHMVPSLGTGNRNVGGTLLLVQSTVVIS